MENNCKIFDKFLSDDLIAHEFTESVNGNINVLYKTLNESLPVNIRLQELQTIKQNNIPDPVSDIWYPLFINNDNFIDNKVLSRDGAVKNPNLNLTSGRIGIENFISFQPKFQNLGLDNESSTMSIDWILNQSEIPYYLEYGIVCWYKLIPRATDINRIHNSATLDKFPVGTRLGTDSLPNITLIKLDNVNLYRIDKNEHPFVNNNVTHISSDGLTRVKLSDLGANSDQILFYRVSENAPYNEPSVLGDNSVLWIADGDSFSYFDSLQDRTFQYQNKVISNSFISAALHNKYSQIYNVITSYRKKRVNQGVHLRQSRLAKKLASVLSTSPFITDFHINCLHDDSILSVIRQYLEKDTNSNETGYDGEIEALRQVILEISTKLKEFNLGSSVSEKTLSNNLIFNKKNLVSKLFNKYNALLKISSETIITYRPLLQHGDSINIQQTTQNLCAKNLASTKEKVLLPVYNNQSIILNNIQIHTNITDTSSDISLLYKQKQPKIIPLADIAKLLSYKATINILMKKIGNVGALERDDGVDLNQVENSDVKQAIFYSYPELPAEIIFDAIVDVAVDPGQDKEKNDGLLSENISFLWEQVSGPKVMFSDTNYSGEGRPSKFDTSSTREVTVYTTRTGEYCIQCTLSTPYGSFIKKKTFYVVDGRQKVFNAIGSEPNDPPTGTYGKYAPEDVPEPPFGSFNNARAAGKLLGPIDSNSFIIIEDSIGIPIPTDNLRVMCPNLSNVIIDKNGIFWPRQSGASIRIFDPDKDSNDRLGGHLKYSFGDNEEGNKSNSLLKLKYSPNNTIIKILKIGLYNIRNEYDPLCANCLSTYETSLDIFKAIIPGSDTDPPPGTLSTQAIQYKLDVYRYNGFQLVKFRWDPTINGGVKDMDGSNVATQSFNNTKPTTATAPPIKSYGGYGHSILNTLVLDIPDLPKPPVGSSNAFKIATEPVILPPITGFNLNEQADPQYGTPPDIEDEKRLKFCYQKAVRPAGGIVFEKGVFHPSTGWIKHSTPEFEAHKNLSSVLKFNPGARESFSFVGPGLYDLKSVYNRVSHDNIPKIYKSAISLSIAGEAQWDPLCTCAEGDDLEKERIQLEKNNQINKELIDQYVAGGNHFHHGYRYLDAGQMKRAEFTSDVDSITKIKMDEFRFLASKYDATRNEYSVSYNYSFPVCGPSNPITEENIANVNLRNPRINNLTIFDIEVKLNFLNYVNTKNLVIWLEMSPFKAMDDATKCALDHSSNSNQFIVNNFDESYYDIDTSSRCPSINTLESSIPNTELIAYLNECVKLNGSSTYIDKNGNTRQQGLKLCLLNQENIQNNGYNFSIVFSDHASKNSVPYDRNSFNKERIINPNQVIASEVHELQPTTSAPNYSDKESIPYQNIIRQNNINLKTNSFVKFKGHQLFIPERQPDYACGQDKSKQQSPSFSKVTTFTLNVMILDENHDMKTMDLVNNNALVSNFTTVENKSRSPDMVNSLCSWELILHTEKTKKFIGGTAASLDSYGNSDPLSLIEYGKEPKYPGYSFIANFKDTKHLIPRVNANAPYTYMNEYSLCNFLNTISRPIVNQVENTPFPEWAAMLIYASTAVGIAGGSILGALGALTVAGVGFAIGYSAITNFLFLNRLIDSINDKKRDIYFPKYDNFPFGTAEKTLLNVSKDGIFWYKLEASIFKYSNCPILPLNKYKFIKLAKDNSSFFSNFSIEVLPSVNSIVDDIFISLSIDNSYLANLPPEPTISDIQNLAPVQNLSDQSIFSVSATFATEQISNTLNGIYIKSNNTIIRLKDNPLGLLKSNKYLQYNSISVLFGSTASPKLIKIKGKVAFYMFNIGEQIGHFGSESPGRTTIVGKGLVLSNNQYYTILNLANDITGSSSISHVNHDTIVVFKPQTTKVKEYPINVWGLEKQQLNKSSPENPQLCTHGLGSYGDGSLSASKSILSYNSQRNNLQTIYEILDNNNNDKKKYNNLTIFYSNPDGSEIVVPVNNSQGAVGYSCPVSEFKEIFLENNNVIISSKDNLEGDFSSITNNLLNNTSTLNNDNYEIIFVKCPSLGNSITGVNYGDVAFEQDFLSSVAVNNLDQVSVSGIATRVKFLEGTNTTIANQIGIANKTSSVIANGSISDIQNHYNALPNDPVSCNKTITPSCYKQLTKQALYDRYNERNELIQVLENQSVMSTGVNGQIIYTAKPDNSAILPQVRLTVTKTQNNIHKVQYENIGEDYYWINIDPKQACTLAEDVTAKVLKKTKYKYSYSNGSLTIPDNNACPSFLYGGGGLKGEGDEIVRITSPDTIEYEIPENVQQAERKFYEDKSPDITWREQTIERSFMVLNDNSLAGEFNTIDILVRVTETYDVALPCFMIEDAENCVIKNDGSADVNVAPGSSLDTVCDGFAVGGGKGLMIDRNTRYFNHPVRVYNIFNLDDANDLKVQFRKVPRQIRGIDYNTTVNRYGKKGAIFRPLVSVEPPVELARSETLNNNFYCWRCLQLNDEGLPIYVPTTKYLTVQNEMMFRAFFGSVDRIEVKDDLQSLFPFEMIPYEYDYKIDNT